MRRSALRLLRPPQLRQDRIKKLVIPASFNSGTGQAGLRRQDAEANIRAAALNSGAGHGPKGTPQERRVIHFAFERESTIKMDDQLRC
jgi:hypothetical protein